jgi:probable HAF family extracellular repeat protein
VRNLTGTAPGTVSPAPKLICLLASTLAACGPGAASRFPDAVLSVPAVAVPAASAGLPDNTTEIDFARTDASAIPAVAATAVGGNPDQARVLATYSVINLAPGNLVGIPAINAKDQVAMTVENAAGVRSYFFNGQTVRDIGTLGGPFANATALNDAGQVSGSAAGEADKVHAFRWSQSGGMRDLGAPGAGNSFGNDINQRGQVAGYFETTDVPVNRFAFRWDETHGMVDLGVLPGESTSTATAINDKGMVTGFTDNRAFVWTRAQGMFSIGDDAIPLFINNAAQVAGYFESARLSAELFVWTAAMGLEELGTLGGSQSLPFGMNAAGQVVGMSDTADPAGLEVHAMSWTRSGGMLDLGVLGGAFSSAQAVNDGGRVVGQSTYRAGVDQSHAFLWTKAKGMLDLNNVIPAAPSGLELFAAWAISPSGAIVADSNAGLVLLKPGPAGTDAPVIGPIMADVDPVPVGKPVTFTASFSDQNSADKHRATWSWGGGCGSPPGVITEANGKGRVTGTRTWCTAGSYWITLKVTDITGRSTTVARQVTVGGPALDPVAGRREAMWVRARKWTSPTAPAK